MRRRAGARRAELHLGLIFFGISDEFVEVADRQVFARFQHQRNIGNENDRGEIGRRVIKRVLVKGLTLGMRAYGA